MKNVISFVVALVAGALCLAANQLIISPGLPALGEDYWIRFAAQNYTEFSSVLMVVSGLLIAWRIGGNPVLIGLGAVAIFPVLGLPGVLRGSHHLLPFELMFGLASSGVYLLYSLPAMGGAFVGWLIKRYSQGPTKI